jgi:hypothetical protein
MGNRYLFVD